MFATNWRFMDTVFTRDVWIWEVEVLCLDGAKAINPGSARAAPSHQEKPFSDSLLQFVDAVLVRQLLGPHLITWL